MIQEKIQVNITTQNLPTLLKFTIENNQILKQLVRTYYDNSDEIIVAAKSSDDDIFNSVGQHD